MCYSLVTKITKTVDLYHFNISILGADILLFKKKLFSQYKKINLLFSV